MSFLSILRTNSRWRITAVLLCLLACTVQGFVAQTHVHRAKADSVGAAAGAYVADGDLAAASTLPASNDDDGGKHPGRSGDTSCPLCQIVMHGGAAPALVVFIFGLAPQTSLSVPPEDQVPSGTSVAVSFNWQGRAPPLG